MPAVPNAPLSPEYQLYLHYLHVQQQREQPHQDPKHQIWRPPGRAPGPASTPMPIHLPSSAPSSRPTPSTHPTPSSHPPPNRLRRHRPDQQQRSTAYHPYSPQPQRQMTQAPAQGHHSQPSTRPRSQSRSELPPQFQPYFQSSSRPPSRSSTQQPQPQPPMILPCQPQNPAQGHYSQHSARPPSRSSSHPPPEPQPQSREMTQVPVQGQGHHSQRPPSRSSSHLPPQPQPQFYQQEKTQVPVQGHYFQPSNPPTQVPAQGHHSQPPNRPISVSSSDSQSSSDSPPSSQPQITQTLAQSHHFQQNHPRSPSRSRPPPQPQSQPYQPQTAHIPAHGDHLQPQNRSRSLSRSRPPQPQPQSHQSQTTQVLAQGHHSQAPNRPPSPSRSRPPQTRTHSPPPARSQSRNPRPTTPSRSRSHSRPRSPYPRRENDGSRAFLKGIADDTIAALNNNIVDVSTTQQHTKLFLQSSRELTDWRRHRHYPSSTRTKIEVLAQSTLQGARHLHGLVQPESKIGVLNFASATKPGGGFLNGARAQEESIARSSSLYPSLTTDAARPFYTLHTGRSENYGFYTHAMIYSPTVYLFRDDDGDWLEPIPVDIVTSPAVNAGKVRRLYPHRGGLEKKIEDAMHERMARILALFEMNGATSLVLGSFGTGVFQNDVGMVAKIWRDLLIERDARFRTTFREVVFCIPDERTRGVFEAALFPGGSRRGPYVPVHGGGGDGVP